MTFYFLKFVILMMSLMNIEKLAQYESNSTEILLRFCHIRYRSNRLWMFYQIGVLENFPNFTGEHLWQSRFFGAGVFMSILRDFKNTGFLQNSAKRLLPLISNSTKI